MLTNNLEILDVFLDHIYRKKILKNILQKNDKSEPYYGIIVISVKNDELKKIIKKKFNSQVIVR